MIIQLFVYGTLKRGLRNHSLCRVGQFQGSGLIPGRLYDLPAGYPALTVPRDSILAWSTGNIERDCHIQDRIDSKELHEYNNRTFPGWDIVTEPAMVNKKLLQLLQVSYL